MLVGTAPYERHPEYDIKSLKVAKKSWMKGIKTAKVKDLCSTFPLLPSVAAQPEGRLLLTFCCSSLAFLLCLHLLLWSLPLSPVSSLFTPGLYSWLVVRCFCFPKSHLFLHPPSPSSAPSITHSLLLTSPCYLLSICPCIISPLAHLSLSPVPIATMPSVHPHVSHLSFPVLSVFLGFRASFLTRLTLCHHVVLLPEVLPANKCLCCIILPFYGKKKNPFMWWSKRKQPKEHVERRDILPRCRTIVNMRKTLVGITCFILCLVVVRPTSYNDILATTRLSRTPV